MLGSAILGSVMSQSVVNVYHWKVVSYWVMPCWVVSCLRALSMFTTGRLCHVMLGRSSFALNILRLHYQLFSQNYHTDP